MCEEGDRVVIGVGFLDVAKPHTSVSHVAGQCLSGCRVRLRGTLARLGAMSGLVPFLRVGPCHSPLTGIARFLKCVGSVPTRPSFSRDRSRVLRVVHSVGRSCVSLRRRGRRLGGGERRVRTHVGILRPFASLSFSLRRVVRCGCVHAEFKGVGISCCRQLRGTLLRSVSTLFLRNSESTSCICNICFMSSTSTKGISSVVQSLRFRGISLLRSFNKAPLRTCQDLSGRIRGLASRVRTIGSGHRRVFHGGTSELLNTEVRLRHFSSGFSVQGFTTQARASRRRRCCVLYN